ncbi:MAG: hypothetical protein Q4F52_11455 [Bacteroidaceae bacterium]|nr:hypothetical protein [Bacteroidaceae bacterium]
MIRAVQMPRERMCPARLMQFLLNCRSTSAAHPKNEADVLSQLNKQWQTEQHDQILPKYLSPAKPSDTKRTSVCWRITPQFDELLRQRREQLGVDTSSILRLAVYHYLASIANLPTPLTPEQLQEHLAELEARGATAGLPPFADLMIPSGKRQE